MNEKPEALRLANDLETVIRQEDAEDNVILVPRWTAEDSVAELRLQHAEIERLKADIDAPRRDAERYRWLRERAWFQFEFDGRYGDSGETVQELDAAIDAAMGDKT